MVLQLISRIVYVVIAVCLVFPGRAQESSNKVAISLFVGSSIVGAKSDIKSTMIESGFDDTSRDGDGGTQKHPDINKEVPFDLELSWFFSEQGGISLNGGMADHVEVSGYDNIGAGNYMFVQSELWSFALCYTYSSKNQRSRLSIGPSYFIHDVKETTDAFNNPEDRFRKFGIYAGYSYLFVNKRRLIMALRANVRWTTGSEIGPYGSENTLGMGTTNPTVYRSVFQATTVNPSVINFGMVIGINAGN